MKSPPIILLWSNAAAGVLIRSHATVRVRQRRRRCRVDLFLEAAYYQQLGRRWRRRPERICYLLGGLHSIDAAQTGAGRRILSYATTDAGLGG
mgnify:CR=1 FL=1